MQTPFGELPEEVRARASMAEAHEYLMSRRRFLRNAALAAGAVAVGPTLWRRPGWAATPPAGEHLMFGADPRTQMTVSWMTDGAVEQPVLDVGLDATYGTTIPADTRAVAGVPTAYHHVRLEGLSPDTTYHYRARHAGGDGIDATFRTAPATPAAFTLTAFGDQGVSGGAASTTARVLAIEPAFHFLVGDLCYAYRTGTGDVTKPAPIIPALQEAIVSPPVWDAWFRQVAPSASTRPWMTTVGNHEMEYGYGPLGYDGYFARFSLPLMTGALPTTYAFRYGNLGVVALDGNDASHEVSANRGYGGPMQDSWLASTLAALRADPDIDFIIAGFHNCSYCTNVVHASDGGVRDRWSPLFDTYAVDLVVNGHNHCYERAHPIRAGAPTVEVPGGGIVRASRDGTTYVTAGGGGQVSYQAALYPVSYVTNQFGVRVPETAEWSAIRYLDLSLIALDVAPRDETGRATMTMRALRPDGTEIETLTFERVAP